MIDDLVLEENIDKATEYELRKTLENTSINISLNTTELETGRHLFTAHIMRDLYRKFNPDEVTIQWNYTDDEHDETEDEIMYSLDKEHEAKINWDDIFISDREVSPYFIERINFYIDETEE